MSTARSKALKHFGGHLERKHKLESMSEEKRGISKSISRKQRTNYNKNYSNVPKVDPYK